MSNDDLSELSDAEVEQKCKRVENEKKIYEAQQKIAEAKNALNPSEMEKAQTLAEQQKKQLPKLRRLLWKLNYPHLM
nr:hypothetical protein [Methanobacterium formicicum]